MRVRCKDQRVTEDIPAPPFRREGRRLRHRDREHGRVWMRSTLTLTPVF